MFLCGSIFNFVSKIPIINILNLLLITANNFNTNDPGKNTQAYISIK